MLLLAATVLTAAGDRPRYRIEPVAGGAGNGDGGPAVEAQIAAIQGIALDAWGNVYISDTDRHRVRKVDANGAIATVAGTGEPGFSGDGGPASEARLNLPYGLAVDRFGALFIADLGNNRVRRVAPDGVISTFAGNGSTASSGSGIGALEAALLAPRNLAVDAAGNLYISEFEGHRVRKVDAKCVITTVAGTGAPGFRGDGGLAANAQLNYPAGLALDANGALYVADSGNNRVRELVPGGVISTRIGDRPETALLAPVAVTVDAAGTIYVADSEPVVRAFTRAGAWFDFAGTGILGFDGEGGAAAGARLSAPRELAARGGAIYIADGVRVRVVDGMRTIRTLAGDGFLHAIGDGGRAAAARLSQPAAIALDASGALFIADTGTHRIRRVAPGGAIGTLAGTGLPGYEREPAAAASAPLDSPAGVAVDAAGSVAIADTGNRRIRQVSADGRIRTILNAGSAGPGPGAVCADAAGAVYVVDTPNHRVLRLTPGGVMEAAAGTGAPGDAGDGGPAHLAQLAQPAACATNAAGALFIADTLNHRIRRAGPDGTIATVAGDGVPGFAGDEGPAAAARLNAPRGVAADSDGNIFIADSGNHRIRQVTPDGVIHTIAGRGEPGYGGDGGPAAAAQLNRPAGLALDGSGHLYLADTGNDRIRRLAPDGLGPLDPAAAPEIALVNAASLLPGPVAPGGLVSIFGTDIGPDAGVSGEFDEAGLAPDLLAGAQVLFDGVPAPLLYVQAGQINAQAPYALADRGSVRVETFFGGNLSGTAEVQVAAAAPALFRAVVNQDGAINSEADPAARGQIAVFYATGEGLTDGANVSGKSAAPPYAHPKLPVEVRVAGIPAEILYAGSAPGFAGLMQINARVPAGYIPPGRARTQLTIGTAASPEIEIWLK